MEPLVDALKVKCSRNSGLITFHIIRVIMIDKRHISIVKCRLYVTLLQKNKLLKIMLNNALDLHVNIEEAAT